MQKEHPRSGLLPACIEDLDVIRRILRNPKGPYRGKVKNL
jgi:hypothetical protein